ncbi:MAG: ABC transporter ATP-binding protein [Ruminococcaceae bacterium]|nr:ABC transporter ATP-binding protein [Oscillospiraceae bacterium]
MKLEDEFVEAYLKNEAHPYRTLLRLYMRYWKELLLSLIFYFIKTSPVLALPIVTANIINIATARPENALEQAAINIAVIVFLMLLNIPTHILHVRYYSRALRGVEAGLRGAMVRKLQQLSITFHKEMQSGRIQSKLMRDVETVHALSSQIFLTIPGIVINMVTALVVVVTKNLTVFSFFLLTIPTSVIIMRIFNGNIRKYNAQFRKDMENTSADIMDMIEMNQITRAHALENVQVKKLTGRLNSVANTGFKLDMTHAKFGSVSWVVFSLFQLLCLVFSAFLAFNGKIEIGDISLYQSYFNTLTGQVSTLIGLFPVITKGMDSVSSIGEILGARDIEDNKGKKKMTTLKGEYDFRDVDFFYTPDQPVLQDLDLKVNAGETIAIVGESGSGKSTILNLVLGFNKPKMGKIFIDGKDMDEIDLQSYRKHIAIVPQTSVLFTGTIKDNITYGFSRISKKRIDEAVKAANLTEFINSLPQGLDTMLDEHGANLSGGQRQRIAIARAIIRDPKVIIFDEATSALDTVSEKEIQSALNNLTEGRTTFIVAHRLSTIRDADRIAVIKQGRCVEIGTYDALMEKRGEYYKMQTLQDGVK